MSWELIARREHKSMASGCRISSNYFTIEIPQKISFHVHFFFIFVKTEQSVETETNLKPQKINQQLVMTREGISPLIIESTMRGSFIPSLLLTF